MAILKDDNQESHLETCQHHVNPAPNSISSKDAKVMASKIARNKDEL
jgi:hypothetical protein